MEHRGYAERKEHRNDGPLDLPQAKPEQDAKRAKQVEKSSHAWNHTEALGERLERAP
jgi:hypothetical protein